MARQFTLLLSRTRSNVTRDFQTVPQQIACGNHFNHSTWYNKLWRVDRLSSSSNGLS